MYSPLSDDQHSGSVPNELCGYKSYVSSYTSYPVCLRPIVTLDRMAADAANNNKVVCCTHAEKGTRKCALGSRLRNNSAMYLWTSAIKCNIAHTLSTSL